MATTTTTNASIGRRALGRGAIAKAKASGTQPGTAVVQDQLVPVASETDSKG